MQDLETCYISYCGLCPAILTSACLARVNIFIYSVTVYFIIFSVANMIYHWMVGIVLELAQRDWGKPWKPVGVVSVWTEIWTRHQSEAVLPQPACSLWWL
jgi:hypothetical protein